MPIIPRYNLTQTSTHVHIEVSVPHVRVSTSTLELVIVDGTELHLYAPPTYLLKLTLPNRAVDEDAVEESLAGTATPFPDGATAVMVEDVERSNVDEDSTSTTLTTPLWTKDDLPKLQYNPEKGHGTLVVILRKEQEGFWEDLDLLGRLQQPTQKQQREKQEARSRQISQLVKVIDEDNGDVDIDDTVCENDTSAEVMDDLLSINQQRPSYGLFQHFSNVFRDYAREGLAHEMLECPNPDEVYELDEQKNKESEQENRREMRLEMEHEKFDADRYLNDLMVEEDADMIFDSAMMMKPHWMKVMTAQTPADSVDNITNGLSKLSTSDNQTTFFTEEESHLLATLPHQRNSLTQLTIEQKRSAFLSLTDILFAYAYDHRTTDGDPTVESSWTVMILSPSLSWLENYNPPYDTVVDIVRWNIRRSLIYPYLRSYNLAMKIAEDVRQIVNGGRRTIIRCLLQLHKIMEMSESHYLFNKMYIDPLIGWVQLCEENEVQTFGKEMEVSFRYVEKTDDVGDAKSSCVLDKEHLCLGLIDLEDSFFRGDEESTSSSEDTVDGASSSS